jgi:hypothetical protein
MPSLIVGASGSLLVSMLVATGGREDCAHDHGKHDSPYREPEAGPTIARDGWLHDKQASGQDDDSDLQSSCNSVHPSPGPTGTPTVRVQTQTSTTRRLRQIPSTSRLVRVPNPTRAIAHVACSQAVAMKNHPSSQYSSKWAGATAKWIPAAANDTMAASQGRCGRIATDPVWGWAKALAI